MRTIAWPLPSGCSHAGPVGLWPRSWGLEPLLLACLPARRTHRPPPRTHCGAQRSQRGRAAKDLPLTPRASTAGTARRWRPLAPPPGRGGGNAGRQRTRRAPPPGGRRTESQLNLPCPTAAARVSLTARSLAPLQQPPVRSALCPPTLPARGPRRLGSTRTPKAPLTLTLFLSPRVGAVTNSRSTLPTLREADPPGEDGVDARE